MEYANDFYESMVMDLPAEQFEQFFIRDIRDYIEDKMCSAIGRIMSAYPLNEDEFLKILNRGLGDDSFNRQFILARIGDFAASCKCKNALNQWVVDYFYVSCLRQLLGKRLEHIKKTEEFAQYVQETIDKAEYWISMMEIPSGKKLFGIFGKSDEGRAERAQIDAAQLYPSLIDLTERMFIIYHSLAAGLDKSRNDVSYEYELVLGEIDFAEIEEADRKDAVKAARIQKDQDAVNLFENLITLYFLHAGQSCFVKKA